MMIIMIANQPHRGVRPREVCQPPHTCDQPRRMVNALQQIIK